MRVSQDGGVKNTTEVTKGSPKRLERPQSSKVKEAEKPQESIKALNTITTQKKVETPPVVAAKKSRNEHAKK